VTALGSAETLTIALDGRVARRSRRGVRGLWVIVALREGGTAGTPFTWGRRVQSPSSKPSLADAPQ
jgi:hypothetical protein